MDKRWRIELLSLCFMTGTLSAQVFPLPYVFPVYVSEMPYGLDVSLRKELAKRKIFREFATSKESAVLTLKLVDQKAFVFELPDGSHYHTAAIMLSASNLKDLNKGKAAKVASRVAKEIGKLVNYWLGQGESALLVQFGPPYQLIPLSDGGKVLVWYSEEVRNIPGRTYSQGGLRVCGSTGGNASNPPQPIYCSGPVQTVIVPPKEKRYVTYRMFWVSKEGIVYNSATRADYNRLERLGDALEQIGRGLQQMGK